MYNEVLIADDEADICEFLKKILERRGYRVTTAHEGLQAQEILKRDTFDLLFLDYNMPGLSGFDLIKLAREKNPEAAIIIFTGHPTVDGRVADELGANAFLQKPLTVRMIEEILGGIE